MGMFDSIYGKHTKLGPYPGKAPSQYYNADFKPIMGTTKQFEGGFQNMEKDSANYCPAKGKPGSQLIGTKYGISAIGWAQYNKRCPTVIEIKNLTPEKAYEIAKNQYWKPIQGDKIKSQALAHLIFDITYGGSAGPLQVRQSINELAGKNTVKEFKSFTLSDKEIEWINKLPEKKLMDAIYNRRKNFYKGHTYEAGLTNRLNKLYSSYMGAVTASSKMVKKHWGKTLLVIGAIGLIGFGIYHLTNKKAKA